MSEFKFSCPNCQQNIQATPEYSGLQINCPACQTPLIVPQAPGAPPPPPPPPPGARLTMAASIPNPAVPAPTVYAGPPVRKKKSKAGPIVGWSVAACVVAALIIFGLPALKKSGLLNNKETKLEEKATNAVTTPPPPPELTTEEILQKVNDAYKNMTDYTARAKTVAALDMSAMLGGKGAAAPGGNATMNLTVNSALELGRTNFYRLQWEQNIAGMKIPGAAWNSGAGDFVGTSPAAARKVKNRQEAMTAASAAMLLSPAIVNAFFAAKDNIANDVKDFTKTNESSVNGLDCYVLLGEIQHQPLMVWVNKKSFILSQVELTLGGKSLLDEAELKKLPAAQRSQLMQLAKVKGTVTETYDNIQTNQQLLASAFASPLDLAANPGQASQTPSPKAPGRMGNPGRRTRQPQ